jgi:branched-chain amino acid transport system permease protein
MFPQLLANSLIAGAIYALVAAGFALIYSTCRFIHFAHGSVVAFGGYALYLFYSLLGINFWISVVLAIISGAILGFLINEFIYRPLRERKASNTILLIASISVLMLVESLLLIGFGADVKVIDFLTNNRGLEIGGAIITTLQVTIIGVALALFLLIFLFIKYSKIGKAMRAVADNKDVAEIVGISAEKTYRQTFVLGSAVASVAGILIALEQNLEPSMGTALVIKGFTASVVGGMGTILGSLVGATTLGLAENFGIWYLPSGYKDAIAFVILFLFLLVRPSGILGVKNSLK